MGRASATRRVKTDYKRRLCGVMVEQALRHRHHGETVYGSAENGEVQTEPSSDAEKMYMQHKE